MHHVCIDGRLILATGLGTFIKNILGFLPPSKYLVTLLVWEKDIPHVPERENLILKVMKSPIYTFLEQFELPLKIPSCALFWSPHFNIPLLPIRAKKRLTTIHDVFHLAHKEQFGLHQRAYAKLMYSFALKRSDHVTTISHFSFEEIKRYCAPTQGNVSVIPQGVGKHFTPSLGEEKKQEIRRRYRLPPKFFLAIGNYKPHKNIERLLAAFSSISCEEYLILVGKESKGEQERVIALGYVEDSALPFLYSMATALIFPSLYEGFGAPPLEAMASGCPVITSSLTSLPEVCGDACLYVDPYDEKSIARAMVTLATCREKRAELVERGFERVRHFSFEKCKHSYEQLIQTLITVRTI